MSKKVMKAKEIENLRDIFKIWQVSLHHNIVRFDDYFESQEYFYMCLELHSPDTLFDFINRYSEQICEEKARDFGLKIGSALDFLHQNGIILKNLESTGILMSLVEEDEDTFEKSVPRIKRLSQAEVINYEENIYIDPKDMGDIRFRAPEIVSGSSCGFSGDSWSFGIILYQLLTGHFPFEPENQKFSSKLNNSIPTDKERDAIEYQILVYAQNKE